MKPNYNPNYIKQLFDEMSETYGVVNLISSFGFAALWRKQCLNRVKINNGDKVVDLMTGMGELVSGISKKGGVTTGIDISPKMCELARKNTSKYACEIIESDVFKNELPNNSADIVVCSFGLKTLSELQRYSLAREIDRLLRPGGVFSLVEISIPAWWLKPVYMFYLNFIVPVIGRVLMGNPDNYKMLGIYTTRFTDCSEMHENLKWVGLESNYEELFFGCATCVWGRKNGSSDGM